MNQKPGTLETDEPGNPSLTVMYPADRSPRRAYATSRRPGALKAVRGSQAVDGVSFEIAEERSLAAGPNGAGKTTTVERVIGLREPDSGVVEVCGIDARRQPREVKQKIGAALQSTALQDKITPREALALYGGFYANRSAPQVLLDRFALSRRQTRRSIRCPAGRSSVSLLRWPS